MLKTDDEKRTYAVTDGAPSVVLRRPHLQASLQHRRSVDQPDGRTVNPGRLVQQPQRHRSVRGALHLDETFDQQAESVGKLQSRTGREVELTVAQDADVAVDPVRRPGPRVELLRQPAAQPVSAVKLYLDGDLALGQDGRVQPVVRQGRVVDDPGQVVPVELVEDARYDALVVGRTPPLLRRLQGHAHVAKVGRHLVARGL